MSDLNLEGGKVTPTLELVPYVAGSPHYQQAVKDSAGIIEGKEEYIVLRVIALEASDIFQARWGSRWLEALRKGANVDDVINIQHQLYKEIYTELLAGLPSFVKERIAPYVSQVLAGFSPADLGLPSVVQKMTKGYHAPTPLMKTTFPEYYTPEVLRHFEQVPTINRPFLEVTPAITTPPPDIIPTPPIITPTISTTPITPPVITPPTDISVEEDKKIKLSDLWWWPIIPLLLL